MQIIFSQVPGKLSFWKQDGPRLKGHQYCPTPALQNPSQSITYLRNRASVQDPRHRIRESQGPCCPAAETYTLKIPPAQTLCDCSSWENIPTTCTLEPRQSERQREYLQNHPVPFARVFTGAPRFLIRPGEVFLGYYLQFRLWTAWEHSRFLRVCIKLLIVLGYISHAEE